MHRMGTLMTVLVLGIAIVLPLGLYITLVNLDRLDLRQQEWGALTVFTKISVSAEEARSLALALENHADVAAVSLVSPAEGLSEFQAASGFGQALEALGANPLPWVIDVYPLRTDAAEMQNRVESLQSHLESRPEVDFVQYDFKWLQRLGHLLELGRAAVSVLSLLFGIAVIVVVSNTIRLDVAARAEEIEILALIGAGNSFIRQPFLYSGFWYGLLGGLIAMVLVNLVLVYLDGPIGRLLDSYGQQVELYGPGLMQTLMLLLAGALLGLLGAWISVQRYLRILRIGGSLGRR